MTRSRLVTMNESENGIGVEKQQLVSNPVLDHVVESLSESEEELEVEDEKKKETTIRVEERKKSKSEISREKKRETTPAKGKEVPYPLVPSRKDKERHLARFLDIFKKLEITMPFGDALQQMPLYAKFLKDMETRKNKYIHNDTIVVERNCNTVIQRILPWKPSDPGSVTTPCSIGEVAVGKALIDLGANINLMLLSMCWRLGELEIMPTRMTLQLAYRSVTRTYGVIEDVLVWVKHLIFPDDFVVMDIEEDADIPDTLGRPFMNTASCLVDMWKKS
ncbi:uncharacterized protein [Glycine max]|uniref:uncharacterized protein n=1 Tax=Glycine max TaxID=3847 RepID=UPI0003DEC947|nr:uncharacterized protein LOC100813798 [Glycine max]|eukprot:XP_006605101.1 uncharacterized protein LOC100813798 [Glycine max]